MKKLLILIISLLLIFGVVTFSFSEETKTATDSITKSNIASDKVFKYLAAAIAIGCATLASGIAIGKIGSAAMGAISERPEAGGTGIILAALAEGICLWGFLIAFFILQL